MDECDCDVVPLTFVTQGSITICPVCKGRVNRLSPEEFEEVLRSALIFQQGEPA